MKVVVKNILKITKEYDLEPDSLVSELAELVKKDFDYLYNVKLIYTGHILNHSEPISKYIKETDTGFVVCFQEKPLVVPTATPTVTQIQPITNQDKNQELRKTRAILFAFFRFLSSHQSLNYLYFTSPQVISEMFKQHNFDEIINQLMNNSDTISEGLENNLHTKIDLNIDENLVKTIMMNVLFFTNQNQMKDKNKQENYEDKKDDENEDNNESESESESESDEDENKDNHNSANFTEEDIKNINELKKLGFDLKDIIRVYLMCNRNIQQTANILMDS
jgi:hypothetical protein